MVETLPDVVLSAIQNSYEQGVRSAERGYYQSHEDEDAVTGALGHALFVPEREVLVDGTSYRWRTDYYKLRGRGKNAEEKIYGADGIFQIQVWAGTGSLIAGKGLLFQAKNNWNGKDKKLGGQAALLATTSHVGIVISYSQDGFFACSAKVAYLADGDRRRIPPSSLRSLAEVLGGEFLYCRVGVLGMSFDRRNKRLIVPPYDAVERVYEHEITTSVSIGLQQDSFLERSLSK